MAIKRLTIHRFRGIKEGVINDFGKINSLIGPNNSGKTAILEMLYLGGLAHRQCSFVNRYMEPSTWPAKTLNIYDFLGLEPFPRLRRRHGEAKEWKESPADITDDGSLTITLSDIPENFPLQEFELAAPLESSGRRRNFSKSDTNRISMFQLEPWEKYTIPSDLIPPIFQKYNVRLENSFWNYLWEEPFVYRWEKAKGIDHFAVWALEGIRPQYVVFFDFHVAEQHFTQRFASESYKKIPDWETKIAQSLARVFPELEGANISIKPKSGFNWTGFVEFAGKTPLPIDHFGDGARHAFKVLASLIALSEMVGEESPGLFLWEDPELFMHPAALSRLLKELLSLVKEKPVQLFLSSQSIETTALLTHHIKNLNLTTDYRVLRLDLKDGRLYVANYHYENVISWLNVGMDPRFWGATDLPISYRYKAEEEK